MFKTMVLSLLSVMLLSGYKFLSKKEELVTILPLPQVENKFKPQKIWSYYIGSNNGGGDFYSNLQPTVQNTRVFVANRYGLVKALDADSGKELWAKDLSIYTGCFSRNRPAQLSGGVTAVGNRIYVASELAKVYAMEAKCGSLAWEVLVAGETLSPPVVSDGVILIHTSNGMLQALNEADGALKWTVNLEAKMLNIRGGSTPTTACGTAIVGSDNGLVSAVMLNIGQIIWQQRISQTGGVTEIARINDVQATPVVVNGYVYALAYNGNLAALDLFSGKLMWSREIGSFTNMLVENGIIYLVDQNDRVIAVDAKNGITSWYQSALLHRNLTSPVLNKDSIVIGDSGGYLHWINIDDGRLVAQKKIASALLVTPLFDGDKIIVQATNGEVHAIIR
ncbi:outer membrane protein assembly factor BamB [Candidatus Moranella endobia]